MIKFKPRTLPSRVGLTAGFAVGLLLAVFFVMLGNLIKSKLEMQVTDEALNKLI